MSDMKQYNDAIERLKWAIWQVKYQADLFREIGFDHASNKLNVYFDAAKVAISEIEKYTSETLDERVKAADDSFRNLLNMALADISK